MKTVQHGVTLSSEHCEQVENNRKCVQEILKRKRLKNEEISRSRVEPTTYNDDELGIC